jgi:hypothetical protein
VTGGAAPPPPPPPHAASVNQQTTTTINERMISALDGVPVDTPAIHPTRKGRPKRLTIVSSGV